MTVKGEIEQIGLCHERVNIFYLSVVKTWWQLFALARFSSHRGRFASCTNHQRTLLRTEA